MVNFAVLGCGRIGRMHAHNSRRTPRPSWSGPTTSPARRPRPVAEAHGCRVAGTVAEALNDSAVDAVLIASSTDTHVELITAAAKAGKAILCEKPIDLDIAKVDACWQEIGDLGARSRSASTAATTPPSPRSARDPRRRDRRFCAR